MRNVIINGNSTEIRKLNPFAYKDLIKTLEKSNEARVTINGTPVFRSAVTSGRDVKAFSGMKYHVYFYATEAACKAGTEHRDWMPITAEEFRAYKNDPAYTIRIDDAPVAAEPEQAEPEQAKPEQQPVAAEQPAKRSRKAQREAAAAE
jgi:hypothetical protein